MIELYQLKIKNLYNVFMGQSLAFKTLSFYLFIEYVRPQTIYPEIAILPFGLLSLVLTLVFFLFIEPKKKWFGNRSNKLVILFTVIVIASSLTAVFPGDSYAKLDVMLSWAIVYFLIVQLVNTRERFFVFLLLFGLFNFKMSQHGFFSWASRGFGFADWGVSGAPGWFQNSGEFGIEMCIFFPIITYLYLALKNDVGKTARYLLIFVIFTVVASIIATNSRGAMLGFGVVLFVMSIRSIGLLKGILIAAFLGAVLFHFIPEKSIERFRSAGDDTTSTQRLVYWKDGIKITQDYPVLGIGYNNWLRFYGTFYALDEERARAELPHNIFIEVSSQMGFSGLIIYVLLIISVLRNNRETRKLTKDRDKVLYNMGYAFDMALLGYLVSGFFITVAFYPFLWVHLAFTAALRNVAGKLDRESVNSNVSKSESLENI